MNFKYFLLALFFALLFNLPFYYIYKNTTPNKMYTCNIGDILYVDYSRKYPYDLFLKRVLDKNYTHVAVCDYNHKFVSISADYIGAKPHLDIENGDFINYPHNIQHKNVDKLCVINNSIRLEEQLKEGKINYNWGFDKKKNSYNCMQFSQKVLHCGK